MRQKEERERWEKIALARESFIFEGSLLRKKKGELQDIVTALHIPHNESTKTTELRQLLSQHLKDHEADLCSNNHFKGLCSAGHGQRSQTEASAELPLHAQDAVWPMMPLDALSHPLSPTFGAAGPSHAATAPTAYYYPYNYHAPPPYMVPTASYFAQPSHFTSNCAE